MDQGGQAAVNTVVSDEVFARFRAGEVDAFSEVVRMATPRLIAFLRLMVGSRESAEEGAQDALVLLFREREKIVSADKIMPWLFITAKRLAIRETGRKRHRMEYAVDHTVLEDLAGSLDPAQPDHIFLHELSLKLGRALDTLKAEERELIVLRFFSGLQVKEVSEVMGMPMGSVGVKTTRTLEKLRRVMIRLGVNEKDL